MVRVHHTVRSGHGAGIGRALLSASLDGAVIPGRTEPLSGVGNTDDPHFYPFFDAVQDRGLAAIVHCGIANILGDTAKRLFGLR